MKKKKKEYTSDAYLLMDIKGILNGVGIVDERVKP